MQLTLRDERTPEAIAEVFWLAFQALQEREKEAVLRRLLKTPAVKMASCGWRVAAIPPIFIPYRCSYEHGVTVLKTKLSPQPASTLLALQGLVALGGDALEDSERLYDIDSEYDPISSS